MKKDNSLHQYDVRETKLALGRRDFLRFGIAGSSVFAGGSLLVGSQVQAALPKIAFKARIVIVGVECGKTHHLFVYLR